MKKLLILITLALFVVANPVNAFAADPAVGNEVLDAANTTLTRTGAGTGTSDPYKLQLNLGNANTWTAAQTFGVGLTSNGSVLANAGLTALGTLNLGDASHAASLTSSQVTITTADNNANAFVLQEGANKYLQVKTTNSAENISLGNTTTNPSYNFLGVGATYFGGAVNATSANITNTVFANAFNATASVTTSSLSATGPITASGNLTATGRAVFTPSGTNGVTINTDPDSQLTITGLATATGNALCLDASNNMVLCSASGSSSLQQAYDSGNSISTTNGRDIAFTLSDTAIDGNFSVTTANGGTGYSSFNLANGAGSNSPAQLVSIDNNDTDLAVPAALKVTSAGGGFTTAIDVSDASIDTALAVGANDISGTNFSVTGATGNVTTNGDVAVNGGDVTTTSTTANLFNNNTTTLNIGGAATSLVMGGTFGTTTVRSNTVVFPNATSLNAFNASSTVASENIGGGYGSTGVTVTSSGNISANGDITIDGTSTLTGNVTSSGDVAVNGGDITTSAATGSVFNNNATTLNIGGAATTVTIGAAVGTTTVNNDLTVANSFTANGGVTVSSGQSLNANGSSTFSPNGTSSVTVNTDSDSYFTLTGLQTATGDGLCIDASNNVIKCSGTPSDKRLKKNITNLTNVLPTLLQVQGVRYDLKTEEDSAPGQGKNIGFIAQDLEKYFPELVKTDHNGIKSVDYEKMTAVLVESTKEQQKEIDELKSEVQELKALVKEKNN